MQDLKTGLARTKCKYALKLTYFKPEIRVSSQVYRAQRRTIQISGIPPEINLDKIGQPSFRVSVGHVEKHVVQGVSNLVLSLCNPRSRHATKWQLRVEPK